MDWSFILEDYFIEEKLINSKEKFNCILTRKISSHDVGFKNNSNISLPNMNQYESSIEIFDEKHLKNKD